MPFTMEIEMTVDIEYIDREQDIEMEVRFTLMHVLEISKRQQRLEVKEGHILGQGQV